MTNLQEVVIGIAGLFPEGSEQAQAIKDLVAENQMSQQVKDLIPQMQESFNSIVILAEMLEDLADGFDVIEEKYDD